MKKHFYYLRDKHGLPRVTVCLAEEDGVYCRGIALCSFLDSPTKKIGNAIAAGRAVKAFREKQSCRPIESDRALGVLQATAFGVEHYFVMKCDYDIDLLNFEKGLVQ